MAWRALDHQDKEVRAKPNASRSGLNERNNHAGVGLGPSIGTSVVIISPGFPNPIRGCAACHSKRCCRHLSLPKLSSVLRYGLSAPFVVITDAATVPARTVRMIASEIITGTWTKALANIFTPTNARISARPKRR
jgi:hypothetical protein